MDQDVSAPAPVQGMYGPRPVAVEVALRRVGRDEVEDGGGGATEGRVEAWSVERGGG